MADGGEGDDAKFAERLRRGSKMKSNPALYTRAFAKALSEHLRGKVPDFTETRYGAGGCETCGYGGDEYEVLDINALEREIDDFARTFKP